MHLEEVALSSGRLRRSGSELGARVRSLVREVANYEDEPIPERLPEAYEDRAQPPAIGPEEVLVRDDDDGIVGPRTAHVVASWIHGTQEPELGARFVVSHERPGAPPHDARGSRRPGGRNDSVGVRPAGSSTRRDRGRQDAVWAAVLAIILGPR